VGATLGGYGFFYSKLLGDAFREVLMAVPEPEGASHWTIVIIGSGAMLVGLLSALNYYLPADTDRLRSRVPVVFGGLTFFKESFDRLYGYYVAKVQQRFAMLLNLLEQVFLAGWIIRGGAGLVGFVGLGARALHGGKLHAYVYWFLLGVVLLWGFATGLF
jgi:NADH-quinone oxidoreductase subunit L